MCFAKDCWRYRKSIKRAVVENALVSVLQSLAPSARLVDLALAIFKSAWEQWSVQALEKGRSVDR